jgi:hypothetical protein
VVKIPIIDGREGRLTQYNNNTLSAFASTTDKHYFNDNSILQFQIVTIDKISR